MVADFLFILAGFLLLAPILSLIWAQRQRTIARTLPRAIEIARFHGWVTSGRLMTHTDITEQDAKMILAEACRRGLLAQGEHGRYYLKETAATTQEAPSAPLKGAP